MDEEVGELDALHRRPEVGILEEIGLVELDVGAQEPAGAFGIADQRSDLGSVSDEGMREAAADHAGRAGDQVGGSARAVARGAHAALGSSSRSGSRSLGIEDVSTSGKSSFGSESR